MTEPQTALMWVNHFDLLPGDPSVKTSSNAIDSGVGGRLTGLVVRSTTTGESLGPHSSNQTISGRRSPFRVGSPAES